FTARFETLWEERSGIPFGRNVRDAFADPGLDPDRVLAPPGPLRPGALRKASPEVVAAAARRLFLESDLGIGIDLFFGGGAFDFQRQAAAGLLVSRDASGAYGPAALAEARPDWFEDEVMPANFSGEPYRDAQF